MSIKKGLLKALQITEGLVDLPLGSILLIVGEAVGNNYLFQYGRITRSIGRAALAGDNEKYVKEIEKSYSLNIKTGGL